MPTIRHKNLPYIAQGVVAAFYVEDAAELAGISLVAGDVGKLAYQVDTEELWLLVNATGPVWRPSGRRGFGSSRNVEDNFSFAVADAGGKVYVDKATPVVATFELHATVPRDDLDAFTVIQVGAGAFTLTPVSGAVTIIPPPGKSLTSAGVGAVVGVTPRPGSPDVLNAYGDLV